MNIEKENKQQNTHSQEHPLREFDLLYNVPLLPYIYYIMGSVRISKNAQNIQSLSPLMPCKFGVFNNLWRFIRGKQGELEPYSPDTFSLQLQKEKMFRCAVQEYAEIIPYIPLPKQIKCKVNGVWSPDVEFIRSINEYIYGQLSVFEENECEYHMKMWHDGFKPVKKEEEMNDADDIDSDDFDDDDDDDQYTKCTRQKRNILSAAFYKNIMTLYANVNIEEVMQQNKKSLNWQEVTRKMNVQTSNNQSVKPKSSKLPQQIDFEKGYESMDDFVRRLFSNAARPRSGYAIMLLVDTRNAPDITVYVWKKRIAQYEKKKTVDIGSNHIDYRKKRYFDVQYNGKILNIGQYVGFSTLFLDGGIHQFWSVFDKETRFEPVHALKLWPNYYANITLFEVRTDLQIESEKKRERYARFFNKFDENLIDKLDQRDSRIKMQIFTKIEEALKNGKSINDENDTLILAMKQIDKANNGDIGNENLNLSDYGPWNFHKEKARIVIELINYLRIRDLSPRQYRQVKADAMANEWKDTMNDKIVYD